MFILLLLIACTLLLVYLKWTFSHWQRKGFPYEKPKIPFGILDSVRRRQRSFGLAINDVYLSSKERVLGIYLMTRPALLVRDVELVHTMLTNDFGSFHDRGIYIDEEHDPMSASLFAQKGQTWKDMRTKLTAAFSSGKLKGMFSTVEDIGNKMVAHLNGIISDEGPTKVEIKKVLATYAVDIIASVIFGLDVNSFKDPTNAFNKVSNKFNGPSISNVIRQTGLFLYPALEKFFIRLGWYQESLLDMKEITCSTIEYREQNNIVRKDLLQLLLQLRNTGKVNENDNVWDAEAKPGADKFLSIDAITSQLSLFYAAGFETTASVAAFTIYELSHYPELLSKAIAEVEQVVEQHGKLTYEAVQDMKYMDLCIMETVRKYPGLPFLNRECTQDYPIPDSDLIIEKGTPIIIPVLGIHYDADYFPDPEDYNPERFLQENRNYVPAAYMPFGDGPRQCIAKRMGVVNVKAALALVFMNFNVEVNKDPIELEYATYGLPLLIKSGLNVVLSKKKNQAMPN